MEPKGRSRSKSSCKSSQSTAPSYSVVERSDGELWNERLGLVWPEKPKKRMKKKTTGLVKDCPESSSSSKSSRSQSGTQHWNQPREPDTITIFPHPYFEKFYENMGQPLEKKALAPSVEVKHAMQKYWGPATLEELDEKLEVGEFALYYPIVEKWDEPPCSISLALAYKSTGKKLLSFPVDRDASGQWSVVMKGPEKPQFDTIAQMIRYYSIHAFINPETGDVETFPVWDNEPEDSTATVMEGTNSDNYEILFNVDK